MVGEVVTQALVITNVFGWIDDCEAGVELIVRVAASDVIKIIVIVAVGRCHRQTVRFVRLCQNIQYFIHRYHCNCRTDVRLLHRARSCPYIINAQYYLQ